MVRFLAMLLLLMVTHSGSMLCSVTCGSLFLLVYLCTLARFTLLDYNRP